MRDKKTLYERANAILSEIYKGEKDQLSPDDKIMIKYADRAAIPSTNPRDLKTYNEFLTKLEEKLASEDNIRIVMEGLNKNSSVNYETLKEKRGAWSKLVKFFENFIKITCYIGIVAFLILLLLVLLGGTFQIGLGAFAMCAKTCLASTITAIVASFLDRILKLDTKRTILKEYEETLKVFRGLTKKISQRRAMTNTLINHIENFKLNFYGSDIPKEAFPNLEVECSEINLSEGFLYYCGMLRKKIKHLEAPSKTKYDKKLAELIKNFLLEEIRNIQTYATNASASTYLDETLHRVTCYGVYRKVNFNENCNKLIEFLEELIKLDIEITAEREKAVKLQQSSKVIKELGCPIGEKRTIKFKFDPNKKQVRYTLTPSKKAESHNALRKVRRKI